MYRIGEVPRVDAATGGQIGGRTPVIVSGVTADWPSEDQVVEHVATRHAGTEIPIFVSTTANFGLPRNLGLPEESRILPLAEVARMFASRQRELDGRTWYSRGITWDHLPGIEDLIPQPGPINGRRMRRRNLWLSPGGTTSVLHYDNLHNMLVVVSGEKHLKLFAPEFEDEVYLYPANTAMPHVSRVDVDNPDLVRFPRLARAQYLSCRLGPGDALYLPAYWFHHVKTPDPSVAVNFWWLPPIGDCRGRVIEQVLASNYFYYDLDNLPTMIDISEVSGRVSEWLLAEGAYAAAVLAAAGELIRALRHAVAAATGSPATIAVNRETTLLPAGAPLLGTTPEALEPWLVLAQRVRLRRRTPAPADAAAMVAAVGRLMAVPISAQTATVSVRASTASAS